MSHNYKRLLSLPQQSFFLFGPRGSGKSTWLRKLFPEATYIDLLEEKLFHNYLREPELLNQKLNTLKEKTWVVIDEIQRLPNLLNEVHRSIEGQKLRFALSGSSARKLRKSGVNLLAGRALLREMHPLLPEELGDDFSLEEVLRFGSLPIIWQSEEKKDVLEAYVQMYLREEIQAEALVRNLQGFARFLPVAALFHAQVLNTSSLARDAGVARTSIISYLDILVDTLLAFKLPAFEGKLRVKEKSHPKLYFVDPGLARAARHRFSPIVEEERGALFEGWIASLLRAYKSYKNLFDGWNYWSPTESKALEIDFILWKEDTCIAIECKATERLRPEFYKGLRAFHSSMKKAPLRSILLYLGKEHLQTEDGIEILPLEVFLQSLQKGTLFP